MKTCTPDVLTRVFALAIGSLLVACSGSGTDERWFYFRLNGDNAVGCRSVTSYVDASGAGAVLSRRDDGSAHCALSGQLEGRGCKVNFTDYFTSISVSITGCDIEPDDVLFRCAFTEGEPEVLERAVESECSCGLDDCDPTPPVCIGEPDPPRVCEDCDNNVDDDGDGWVDCADPSCQESRRCESPSTTLSTMTTTTMSSVTTSSSSTTSTSVPAELFYGVTVRLKSADAPLGSLQVAVDYEFAPGIFPGKADKVRCTNLIDDAIFAPNDRNPSRTLLLGWISLTPFSAPVNLVTCVFRANLDSVPVAGDFHPTVQDATDDDANPVSAMVSIIVQPLYPATTTTIDGNTTTTVPPTTTTTLPPTTTTSTTMPSGGGAYDVTFRMDSASADVGSLQLGVDYSAAPGEIDGEGAAAVCTNKVGGALFAPNDDDANSKLTLGIIALTPFAAPLDLVTCSFTADSATAPVAGDFVLTVEDATDSDGVTVTVGVSTSVAAQ